MLRRPNVLLTITYSVALCMISGACVFLYSRHAFASQLAKPVRPFTAQYTKNYYTASGELKKTDVTLYVRASDRSTSSEVTEMFPIRKQLMTEIVDMHTGQRTYLERRTRSVTRFRYLRDELMGSIASLSSESCPADVANLEKSGVFFGYQTLHSVSREDPAWVEEKWVVPELECFAVKQLDYLIVNGATGAHNEKIVTSIAEGEPAPDLITVPTDYVERSPTQVDEELGRQRPGEVFWGPVVVKRMEDKYWRRK
jgi:hypothetical protein